MQALEAGEEPPEYDDDLDPPEEDTSPEMSAEGFPYRVYPPDRVNVVVLGPKCTGLGPLGQAPSGTARGGGSWRRHRRSDVAHDLWTVSRSAAS